MANLKRINQRRHAKFRALERYGVDLNRDSMNQICKRILDRKNVEFLVRGSNRLTFWRVPYQNKDLWTIYDSKRHTVVTFLPPTLTRDKIIKQVHEGITEWEIPHKPALEAV